MTKKLVVIGHIVNDTEPVDHLGGVVSYAGVAACYLGMETHIITKCPQKHEYIDQLEAIGIHVHRLESKSDEITTFENFYNERGERRQVVEAQAEALREADWEKMPIEILKGSIILVGTVIGEVDLKLYPKLAKLGMLGVAPQGYFRKVEEDGNVLYKEWKGFEEYLLSAETVILSQEDLTLEGIFQEKLLEKLRQSCRIVVLTKGEKGAIVYEQGKSPITTTAFRLNETEIKDFTGAGDVYASAFMIFYQQTRDAKIASVIASLVAAIKIAGTAGIGMDSIPTKLQIALFLQSREERLKEYLKTNSVDFDVNSIF